MGEEGEGRERGDRGRGEHLPAWIVRGERHCLAVCGTHKISQNTQSMFLKITFNAALEMLTFLTLNR